MSGRLRCQGASHVYLVNVVEDKPQGSYNLFRASFFPPPSFTLVFGSAASSFLPVHTHVKEVIDIAIADVLPLNIDMLQMSFKIASIVLILR